jgi:hypothetical protein
MSDSPATPALLRSGKPRSPKLDPTDQICRVLRAYADRGVFRSFSQSERTAGKVRFRFLWLSQIPVDLVWDEKTATFTFRNFLPAVPPRSSMYDELKEFIRGRASRRLPKHRRIEASKAEIGLINRKGNVSIALRVKRSNYEYGANRAVNLINEIYMGFLHDHYFDYLNEHFGVPDE